MHEEIKNRVKISTLLESQDNFGKLLGMCALFNKDSEYYKYSGLVTAALLHYEGDLSILAIDSKRPNEWFTFKYDDNDLIKMFNNCDALIGHCPEDSFILEK